MRYSRRFLLDKPEFRNTAPKPDHMGVAPTHHCHVHIGAMSAAETRGYVEHRLCAMGWTGSPEFSVDAFQSIHEHSGGIPRRTNAICDRLLWYGFLGDKKAFTKKEVLEVAEEMRGIQGQPTVVIGSQGGLPRRPPPTGSPWERKTFATSFLFLIATCSVWNPLCCESNTQAIRGPQSSRHGKGCWSREPAQRRGLNRSQAAVSPGRP